MRRDAVTKQKSPFFSLSPEIDSKRFKNKNDGCACSIAQLITSSTCVASVNIRHDTQCKNTHPFQRTTGKHVKQI